MSKINEYYLGKFCVYAFLSGFSGVLLANPFATMDDYDWVVIDTPIDPASYKYDCNNDYDYETYTALQNCFYNLREDADNTLSEQWGISDKVVREKNAIHIKVSNRKNSLVFVDYESPFESYYNPYYSLKNYDESRQLLTLHQSLYESETTTVVNLTTGFWQEFDLRKLSVSPDMRFIAGFESEPGITEDIAIWELQDEGYYQGYYKRVYGSEEDAETLESRRNFYQVKEVQSVYNAETITWLNDNQFHVDYFFKLNPVDSAAFRVRYSFRYDASMGQWKLLKDKV